jgi:hypothetical protein
MDMGMGDKIEIAGKPVRLDEAYLDAIRKDARNLLYFSDGTSGADKIGRLLATVIPLTLEIEALKVEVTRLRAELKLR